MRFKGSIWDVPVHSWPEVDQGVFDLIEACFCQNPLYKVIIHLPPTLLVLSSTALNSPPQAKKTRKKAAFSSPQTPKSPASSALVSLLPVRRATNIGIALRQFKCEVAAVVDAVLAMNEAVLPQVMI
jgi:hypothetical protein